MRKNDDIIAIYSRKSKFTGKGESIGNQVELCKEYVRVHYGDTAVDKVAVYEDEGFSGGNLNRPDFKIKWYVLFSFVDTSAQSLFP